MVSFAVVTSVYKEGKVRKRHTEVCVMQMIAESLLFGNVTGMERIFVNFFFLYGFGFDSDVKKAYFCLARNEHFTRSNILGKNVFSLFSVSHDSVLSLEILKDVWEGKNSF